MFGLPLFAAAAMVQGPSDPLRLPIGPPGFVRVEPGSLVDASSGKPASMDDLVRAAQDRRFVLLGESHDDAAHHRFQAEAIQALVKAGRNVIVGLEMFTRPVQDRLHAWTLGWRTEDEFLRESEWKTQWGFDFALYRPIFEVVRSNRLPMVALNVPRDWVRAVGRGGLAALTAEQRAELPSDIDLGWKDHRRLFEAMMGGHPLTGSQGENVYAAQVLWDVGMADTALKFMERWGRSSNAVMVILAGSGHVMYNQGINGRIRARTGEPVLSVVMIGRGGEVSRGLGDFVYASPRP
ncbi:MAG: ChaN family lipoprotein [Fimbriimonadales bacterium]|nr:ChaN family lipoprotein [Fimbriimonadales bacterium]